MQKNSKKLLSELLSVDSPSSDELPMRDFLIRYFTENSENFQIKPQLSYNGPFQNELIVKFGEPRTAVFAHMDTIGFMTGYGKRLLEIGSPQLKNGFPLKGTGRHSHVRCKLRITEDGSPEHDLEDELPRGTQLVFDTQLEEKAGFLHSAYFDNRIGIWNALQLAEEAQDVLLVFTCREEHHGGSAAMMGKYMYEELGVRQALISDVTWVTEGISHGKGAVVSLRDSDLPRRVFLDRILELAAASGIPYQLEVESSGGSDGNELQHAPYPIDWCFIGAPCHHTHTPHETMYIDDIMAMTKLYSYLVRKL